MKKITPQLALRVGLAFVFIYAGINSLLNPSAWIGFVPVWIDTIPLISREVFLTIHGLFEIVLGLALLFGIYKKLTAALAFLSLAGIIIFFGINDITFRDLGLIAAAYTLFILVRE